MVLLVIPIMNYGNIFLVICSFNQLRYFYIGANLIKLTDDLLQYIIWLWVFFISFSILWDAIVIMFVIIILYITSFPFYPCQTATFVAYNFSRRMFFRLFFVPLFTVFASSSFNFAFRYRHYQIL